MQKIKTQFLTLAVVFFISMISAAQTSMPKVKPSLWDGMAVAGYADKGGFVNFGGPGVKWVQQPFSLLIGMLPSLRIKKDNAIAPSTKNSAVTPSLGVGMSIAFKHLLLQLPFYYNAKTQAADGKWVAGIGMGYKF